jgi:hypothetical protein
MKTMLWALVLVALGGGIAEVRGLADDADAFRRQVEADWLLQETYRTNQLRTGVSVATHADAMGGCDGIKNGAWGFHTAKSPDAWWQVDLGRMRLIDAVVVWNRCSNDAAAAAATNLLIHLSEDGQQWHTVYRHDGSAFYGHRDQRPLRVTLSDQQARWVRIQLAGERPLHLDEIEVFGPEECERNLALNQPAEQSSVSEWSFDHRPLPEPDWAARTREILAHSERLADELGPDAVPQNARLDLARLRAQATSELTASHYLEARWIQRRLTLANPLLNFESILVNKRVPGSYSHMSDQYYGWWSRPGGGIYLLRGFREDQPRLESLTPSFSEPGSFLRPALSYDAKRILFAWCRHYPHLAAQGDKLSKARLPEDAFFHVFEMNLEDGAVRQLTHGKYDDFDAQYLPDGRIVFLSTRRGQALQVGPATAAASEVAADLPDCYVRCGGDERRPVAVYTLHTMKADGSGLNAISPFEMFEWEPAIGHDGSILHARWDYIDRDNMPFMSLWSLQPDGTNPRLVFKNYTANPHCVFEPQPVPGSTKIVFTASGHHSHSMGSLVLLDPAAGTDGPEPMQRLTPEVAFPESEGWPITYYASPWPLSERFHLVSWGDEGAATHADRWHRQGGRWEGMARPENGMGIYFFDAAGNMELLYRDPAITTTRPIPVRARPLPPVLADAVDWDGPPEGRLLVQDVYHGLNPEERETVKWLRVVAVPPKTQPWMNRPNLGLTKDDPGKAVLGTVPVEADGSAYFRLPAGVIFFFQALDDQGRTLRTMRSVTHVQPGQTASCIGCHANRTVAPPVSLPLAARREPSRITAGPEGTWPLRFDRLVQPVLDRLCVDCHRPGGREPEAARMDLSADRAYESLTGYGKPSLLDQVMRGYREGKSPPGEGLARTSALLQLLDRPEGHHGVVLNADSRTRLITWLDVYAQRAGAFSPEQEQELERLFRAWQDLLVPPLDPALPVGRWLEPQRGPRDSRPALVLGSGT